MTEVHIFCVRCGVHRSTAARPVCVACLDIEVRGR